MKNLIYILNILMILIFASCKDENSFMFVDDDNQPCYSILVSAPNNATRAVYEESGENIAVKWEKGDVIDVDGKQFVYKEDRENNAALFVLYAESMPNVAGKEVRFGEADGVQIQSKNNKCHEVLVGTVPAGYSFTNPAEVIPLLPETGKSLLHIQTKSPAMFMGKSLLKVKGLATEEYTIQLGENPKLVFADKNEQLDIYVTVAKGTISSGKTLKFYFYAYDENAGDGKDPQTNGDEFHYYMKCNAPIAMENDKVVKMPLPNRPTHTAIQLGLPSGTKWATMNVGATKESEGGDTYTWGATKTNNFVSANKTYFDLNGTVLDEYKRLKPEYDAATESWGENWVMPTYAETWELVYQGTTWTSATKDGVDGFDVSNGSKSIFLPSSSFYWLSNLVNNNNEKIDEVAYSLYFDNTSGKISNGGGRSTKRFVRPILASSRTTEAYKTAFEDIEGTLSGVFSVDENKKVKFSKGNLQYQASTNTWRFAEHQYDIVGLDNNKISSTYSGWIDLFGWGTSGWDSGAKAYQPYSTSTNKSDYYVGNSQNNDMTDTYKNADWGVYNAISNGGSEAGLWRVLTSDEATHLINKRTNAANLRTKATVNGVPGVLLFPDGWTKPSNIDVTMDIQIRFKTNVYTAEQFEYLEFLGVIFLPAGGYRAGTSTNQLGEGGSGNSYDGENITGTYWTSTHNGSNAFSITFKNKNNDSNFNGKVICSPANCERHGGNNVRLVHEAK